MCLPLRAEEHKLEFFVYSAKIWEGTCKHKVIGLKMYHMPFGHSVNRTKCKKKKKKVLRCLEEVQTRRSKGERGEMRNGEMQMGRFEILAAFHFTAAESCLQVYRAFHMLSLPQIYFFSGYDDAPQISNWNHAFN